MCPVCGVSKLEHQELLALARQELVEIHAASVGYLLALSAEVVQDCTHGGNACQGQIPHHNARHIVPREG